METVTIAWRQSQGLPEIRLYFSKYVASGDLRRYQPILETDSGGLAKIGLRYRGDWRSSATWLANDRTANDTREIVDY